MVATLFQTQKPFRRYTEGNLITYSA